MYRLLILIAYFYLNIAIASASEITKVIGDENNNNLSSSISYNRLLNYKILNEGDNISLNSIIEISSTKKESGFLRLEFNRNDVSQIFIDEVFNKKIYNSTIKHTFTMNGIEPILTKDKFILQIHSGVTLHLRNDIEGNPSYQTFNKNNVIGVATKVSGKIRYSSDHDTIRNNYNDLFLIWRLPDIESISGAKIINKSTDIPTVSVPIETAIPKKYIPKQE